MGIGSSKKREKKEPEPEPVTADQLKTLIKISQERCKLYHNKKVDNVKRKKEEIAECLKKNNYDLAKAKMDNLLKDEDLITAYDLLLPILEIVKEKCIYIISNSECPAELRAPLDSIIFAANKLEINELMTFKEKIKQKYGTAYISKAENNTDKLVNENLVDKLKVTIFNEQVVKIRLKRICQDKKINFAFPDEVVVNVDVPTDLNMGHNIYESTNPAFPTKSMVQGNGGNNYSNTGNYPNFNYQQQTQGPNQGGYPPYPQQNDGFPRMDQPQNPNQNSQIPNPYETSQSQNSNQKSQIPNPYETSQNQNPIEAKNPYENPYNTGSTQIYQPYQPPPMVNQPINPQQKSVNTIIGDTVGSTVPISEAPESKEQSKNPSITPPPITQTQNTQKTVSESVQNPTINDQDFFNKTVENTVNLSAQIPNNINKDPFNVKTIKESTDVNNSNKPTVINNNNNEEEDLFGGNTVEGTVNYSTMNQDSSKFGGKTMNLSIANPNNKENPFEGNDQSMQNSVANPYASGIKPEDNTKDPFAPGANVEDPFGGKTLPEEKTQSTIKDPFAPGASVEDPFGGKTLPEEKTQSTIKDPFAPGASVEDPFGGATLPEPGNENPYGGSTA